MVGNWYFLIPFCERASPSEIPYCRTLIWRVFCLCFSNHPIVLLDQFQKSGTLKIPFTHDHPIPPFSNTNARLLVTQGKKRAQNDVTSWFATELCLLGAAGCYRLLPEKRSVRLHSLFCSKTGGRKPGPLTPDRMILTFSNFRDSTELKFGPPPFHKISSLPSRLYGRERVKSFALRLLGYKNLTMAQKYLDARGVEYVMV